MVAAPVANFAADFDDFVAYTPDGLRSFLWFAYRDPAFAGNPDVIGSQGAIGKLKPAHTFAGFTESKSVLCDDARDGFPDRGPLGNW